MAEFVLHCFNESGNAYKAALTLQLCGADWEPVLVRFFDGETKGDPYRSDVNEMGEVPVLEHKGVKLSQSGVILDYLSAHFGKFGPADEAQRREILRWILWDNHKFTSYFGTLRAMLRFFDTGETPVTEFLRGRYSGALEILEKHLATTDFVAGSNATIADLSLCGYAFWIDEVGYDYADYPNLSAWLDRIRDLPGWVAPYELTQSARS